MTDRLIDLELTVRNEAIAHTLLQRAASEHDQTELLHHFATFGVPEPHLNLMSKGSAAWVELGKFMLTSTKVGTTRTVVHLVARDSSKTRSGVGMEGGNDGSKTAIPRPA